MEQVYEKREALPATLQFSKTLPKQLGGSSTRRVICTPKNGSEFDPGSGYCLIDLIRTPNSALDTRNSVLKFSVTTDATASNDGFLVGGAWAFIDSIEISHNGVQWENIRGFSTLYNILFDCTVDATDRNSKKILYGSSVDANQTTFGIAIAASTTNTFAIPLLGCLGMQTGVNLPTFDLAGYLTLRVNFNPSYRAIKNTTNPAALPAYKIKNVQFHCIYNELSETSLKMVSSPTYRIATQTWSHWSTVMSSGTVINQLVPFRVRDLRQILVCFRRQSDDTDPTKSATTRLTLDINDYAFYINGVTMPPTRVKCSESDYVEPYLELSKSFHKEPGDVTGLGYIHSAYYKSNTPSTARAQFVIGLDCESFSGYNQEIEAGIDTTMSDIVFSATLNTDLGNNATLIEFYCLYGMELLIENGQSMVIF